MNRIMATLRRRQKQWKEGASPRLPPTPLNFRGRQRQGLAAPSVRLASGRAKQRQLSQLRRQQQQRRWRQLQEQRQRPSSHRGPLDLVRQKTLGSYQVREIH